MIHEMLRKRPPGVLWVWAHCQILCIQIFIIKDVLLKTLLYYGTLIDFVWFKTFLMSLVKYVSYLKKEKMQFWLYDNTENFVAGVYVSGPWLGVKGKRGSPFWAISFAKYLQKEVLNCNLQSFCYTFANAKSEKYFCQNSVMCVVIILVWFQFF